MLGPPIFGVVWEIFGLYLARGRVSPPLWEGGRLGKDVKKLITPFKRGPGAGNRVPNLKGGKIF